MSPMKTGLESGKPKLVNISCWFIKKPNKNRRKRTWNCMRERERGRVLYHTKKEVMWKMPRDYIQSVVVMMHTEYAYKYTYIHIYTHIYIYIY